MFKSANGIIPGIVIIMSVFIYDALSHNFRTVEARVDSILFFLKSRKFKWKIFTVIVSTALLVGLSSSDVLGHQEGPSHYHLEITNGETVNKYIIVRDEFLPHPTIDEWGHIVEIDQTPTCLTLGYTADEGQWKLGDSDIDPETGERCSVVRGTTGQTGGSENPGNIGDTGNTEEDDESGEVSAPTIEDSQPQNVGPADGSNGMRAVRNGIVGGPIRRLPQLIITHIERIHPKKDGWFIYIRNEEKRFLNVSGIYIEVWSAKVFEEYELTGKGIPERQTGFSRGERLTYQYTSERHRPEFTNSKGIRANNRVYLGTKKVFEEFGKVDGSTRIRRYFSQRRVPKDIETKIVVLREPKVNRDPLSGRIITYWSESDNEEAVAASPMKPTRGKLVTTWGSLKAGL